MRVKLIIIASLLLGFITLLCVLPPPPPGPESASFELGFELSEDGKIVKKSTFTDTLGKMTKVYMALNLTQYFDSLVLIIDKEPNYADTQVFNVFNDQEPIVKYSITLPASGIYTVTLTGYIEEQQPRTVSGVITIVDRSKVNTNQKPDLTVPKVVQIGTGQELVFSVYATDPDAGQQVSIDPFKKPDSATFIAGRFKWTPITADSGKNDTVIFIASDNGSPVESDTESVIVIISSTPVNLAPRWISNEVKDYATAGSTFEYELNNKCSDPENGKLTFSLVPEFPVGDTIVGTEYIYTPSVSDTGKHMVHIVARDPSGLEDVLTLELTVSTKNIVVDKDPPVFTRVSPATDSIEVSLSTISVSVLCNDKQGGVDSVKCVMGTTPFTVTRTGDSLYSATVTGLVAGWNTVTFTARDTSAAKNPCTLQVHLNYVKASVDKVPPIIKFLSPSKDTVLSVDSFEVKVSCVDDSGCSVKGYRDTTSFTLKRSASDKNLWTGMVKGITAGSYSIIKIVATDSSKARNKDSASVRVKYDNDKSGPLVTLVKPASRSTSTNNSSYNIELKCSDVSGVLSVKGILGADTVPGVRSGDNWSVIIDNLVLGDNKVIITATDSSLRANKTYDTVFIKYDPTIADPDGPIIKQISGPVSGTIVNSAIVEITDSISDLSGVDSVYWINGNGIKKVMTLVPGKTGVYSLKDTLHEGVLDSLVITAYDKSTRKNHSRQVISLTYVNLPSVTKQPVSQTVCSGSQAIFSITAAGTVPLSYQWRTGAAAPFTNIGSNSPICTLTTAATTVLSCVVSNQAAANAISSLCTLSINLPAGTPTGKATPETVLLGDNQTVTLSVTAGNPGTGGAWVWYASDKTTKVATNPFTPTATAAYYVRSENAACGTGAWSSAVQVTVNQPPGTPTGKATPVSVCSGDNQTVTLSIASGDPGTGGSWVWYASDKTTKISTNPFTPSAVGISTFYVRSEGGVSGAGAWSAGIQVTVNQPPATPTPTTRAVAICSGSSTTLSTVGSAPAGVTWYWYTTKTPTSSNQALSSLTVSPTSLTTYYVRGESSSCGNSACDSVVVTVNQSPVAPTPTTRAVTICSGSSATLSTSSNAPSGVTWYWYTNKTPSSSSQALGSLTVSPSLSTTYFVRGESSSCGNSTWDSVVVTVNTSPVSPVPSNRSLGICPAGSAILSTTSSAPSGVTWRWYTTKTPTSTGQALTSLSVSPTNTTKYFVRGETGTSCGNSSWDSVTVTVNSPPSVSISGAAQPVCQGTDVTLYVTTGPGWSYQWTNAAGTQLSIQSYLPFSNIQTTHGGTYNCRVTDGNGCYNTASATLTVNPAPSAGTLSFSSPSPVCSGTNIRLSSSVSGGTSYTWYKSGSSTPVAITNNSYRDWIVGVNDGGSYTCVVTSGGCNSPATAPVQLSVNAAPVITAESNDVTQTCSDPVSYVSFTVNVQGTSGYTFQWAFPSGDTIQAGGRYYSWTSGSDWSTISCLSEYPKEVKCLVWRNNCMVSSRVFKLNVPDRSTCP